MRLTRPLASAAVASSLVLAMSACGPDESDETSGQPVNRPSASSDVAPAGQKVDTREFATLIADAFGKDDTADMSMQLISNGYVTEAEGQIDYSAKTPRMAMTMSVPASGQGDMRTVVVDNTMYVALPTGGKEASEVYYELDLRDEDNPLVKQLGGLSSFDPKSSVEVFAQGLEEVLLVGNDSVEGVPTKHYVVTTSTEGLGDLGVEESGGELPPSVTYDVWLDDKGRLAKMESEFEGQGSMKLTMSNWGGKVDIVAPPADQVQPYPSESASPTP